MIGNWIPEPGMKVGSIYGQGVIKKVIGDVVFIRLTSGVFEKSEFSINRSELNPISEQNNPHIIRDKDTQDSVILHPIPRGKNGESELFKKQECINALRFGLVPHRYIGELTLGYKDLEKWIFSTFPSNESMRPQGFHQVIGGFGEGKSHVMSLIRHLGYKEGYLICRVEVDGKKVTFADPTSIIYSLMSTLKGKDLSASMPALNIFIEAIKRGHNSSSFGDNKLNRFIEIFDLIKLMYNNNRLDSVDHIINDILICSDDITATEAEKEIREETSDINHLNFYKTYGVITRSVKQRPSNFIEYLVGLSLTATFAGYKGLIVTCDEYEVEASSLSQRILREKSHSVLRLIKDYFNGETDYPDAPLIIYVASVPTVDSYSEIGIEAIVNETKGKSIDLQPYRGWNPDDPEQLALVEKIHDLYSDSCKCRDKRWESLRPELNSSMNRNYFEDSGGIRNFMKMYICLLDSLYGPPNESEYK